jgi:hypothetical protein
MKGIIVVKRLLEKKPKRVCAICVNRHPLNSWEVLDAPYPCKARTVCLFRDE